ncbi:MAG: HAMP domain-containing protein [Proteobacteria bacterium]|nr:HAMP domain-containing protein [Pseudomonadota bacterium]
MAENRSSFWNDLKLSYKLGVAIGLMGILMVGIIFFFNHTLKTNFTAFQNVRNTESAISFHAKTLENYMLQCRREEKNFFLRKNKDHLDKFEKNIAALVEEAETLKKIADHANITTASEMALEAIRLAELYKKGFQDIVTSGGIEGVKTPMVIAVRKIEPLVAKLSKDSAQAAENRVKMVESQSLQKAKIAIVFGIISVLSGMAIAYFITKTITGLMGKAIHIAKKISEGDLSQRLDIHHKDEIGILVQAMNTMSINLQKMFQEIAQGVQTLTLASTDLSSISEQITSNSGQTAEKSASVAGAAEGMSTNMNNIAAASEQTTQNIQMIVSAAEEMSATIQEVSNNTAKSSAMTQEAVGRAQKVSEKVDALGKAATQISNVTETIANISKQTNLLALNATIEAARAGEAGKGFAVVASEIKALANQTAAATQEISSKIAGVQHTTSESVMAIKEIVDVINHINDIVTSAASAIEGQSTTTREISNNVSQAAFGVQEINKNVNQTSVVAREITEDIAQVSLAAQEINTGSRQINESARKLFKLADGLRQMVARFKN